MNKEKNKIDLSLEDFSVISIDFVMNEIVNCRTKTFAELRKIALI